jgi:hypothetical protein
MMKTALAFVVAKARLRPRKRQCEPEKDGEATTISTASSSTMNQSNNDNTNREQDSRVSRSRPSVLDGLFHLPVQPMQDSSATVVDSSTVSLLQRHGGTHHLDHMFLAAFNLSKCVVLQCKSRYGGGRPEWGSDGSTNSNTTSALIGATAHLAHQLELLLSTTFSASASASSESSSFLSQREGVKRKTSTRQRPPIPERVENGMMIVQSWIRSTLLHFCSSPSSIMSSMSSKTINTDDIEAAFGVYQILVPQLAVLSPPVIAHIFQVVTRLTRELYDDRLVLPAVVETTIIASCPVRNISLTELDCLATSALKLLELCWTVDIGNPNSCLKDQFSNHHHDVEAHRSFLLLSLQETLGDLLIPLSYEEVLNAQQAELGRDTLDEPDLEPTLAGRIRTLPVTDHASPTPASNDSKTSNEGRDSMTIHQQGHLDEEAKLTMRMAVYRLLMLK